jgi:hypothetical protein
MASSESPFHRGEKAVQAQDGGGERAEQLGRSMILPEMSFSHQLFLSGQSTLMIGAADEDGRPAS